MVVYREISTLTSFKRPRNSFRRSLSLYGDETSSSRPAYRGKNHFSIRLLPFLSSPFLVLAIPNHPAKFESASFRDDDRFILADDPRIRISAGKKVFESRSRHVELIVVRAGINRFHLLFDYYGGLKFAEGVASSRRCQRVFHASAVSRLLFRLQLSTIFCRAF